MQSARTGDDRTWVKGNGVFGDLIDANSTGVVWRELGVPLTDVANGIDLKFLAVGTDVDVPPDVVSVTYSATDEPLIEVGNSPSKSGQYEATNDRTTNDTQLLFHPSDAGKGILVTYNTIPGRWHSVKREGLDGTEGEIVGSNQTLVSYIRADSAQTTPTASTARLSAADLSTLMGRIEKHQMLGEELFFRNAVPVAVDVIISVQLVENGNQVLVEREINNIVAAQCHRIGGTFNVGLLKTQVDDLSDVVTSVPHQPLQPQSLSPLGYFTPGVIDVRFVSDVDDRGYAPLSAATLT